MEHDRRTLFTCSLLPAPVPCSPFPVQGVGAKLGDAMLVLGIETSCDETAAAVVRDGRRLLSSVVSSQVELHEGDRLILLSKGLAAALSDEELTEALQQLPEETLPRLYLKARGMPHCAALLVAALPETA